MKSDKTREHGVRDFVSGGKHEEAQTPTELVGEMFLDDQLFGPGRVNGSD